MNRLNVLNKLAEELNKKVIFKKKVWLIMDKTKRVIAKGVPRNRYLCMVDDVKDKKRLLTYNSEGMARNGFIGSGFYYGVGVNEYIINKYGSDVDYKQCLEPVEAQIIIKI